MSDASEMIFRTIKCFSNDGKLDVNELDQIVKIALADGVVDDEERKVFKNIIYNLASKDLTPEMWTVFGLLKMNQAFAKRLPKSERFNPNLWCRSTLVVTSGRTTT